MDLLLNFVFKDVKVLFWNTVHAFKQTLSEIAKFLFHQDHGATQIFIIEIPYK